MAAINFRADPRVSANDRRLLREFCSSLENDIVALANKLGLKVYREDLMPYERGYLEHDPLYNTPSGFRIVVNENDDPAVQNFTIAHEIGHFLLHRDDAKRRKAHRADKSEPFSYLERQDVRQEAEANSFATQLLMPPNLFKPLHARFKGSISQLATAFFVSQKAVEIRVRELGLS